MATDTFQQIWKSVIARAPDLDPMLARQFVNDAYRRALEHTRWAGERKESAFVVAAPYTTGTVTVTQDSTAVTGSGTTWVAAHVGRQFFVGSKAPYYTVSEVGSTTSLTLDRAYSGSDASGASYSISSVYVTAPSDFLHFTAVRDVSNNWKLHTGVTQEALDNWDSERSSSGDPRLLAAAEFSSSGLPRFELWPRASSAREYPFRYIKRPSDLSAASDLPIYPIRGDIIREGALAELCIWPGTSKLPNPYFNMELHNQHEGRFRDGLSDMARLDQEINLSELQYDDYDGVPYAPLDASWLQQHAFGV